MSIKGEAPGELVRVEHLPERQHQSVNVSERRLTKAVLAPRQLNRAELDLLRKQLHPPAEGERACTSVWKAKQTHSCVGIRFEGSHPGLRRVRHAEPSMTSESGSSESRVCRSRHLRCSTSSNVFRTDALVVEVNISASYFSTT